MAPAREDHQVGEEEEDMSPLDTMAPQITYHVHGEETEDEEEEKEPGKKEVPTPGSEPVAGQEVTDGRDGGKESKEPTIENHLTAVLNLVGESHGDKSNPGDQVADVEEEEESEHGVCGPEDPGRLLSGPDGPQGGSQVPEGLQVVHGRFCPRHSPRVCPLTCCSCSQDGGWRGGAEGGSASLTPGVVKWDAT